MSEALHISQRRRQCHPDWTVQEVETIEQLAKAKDLEPAAVVRQALRTYQLQHASAAPPVEAAPARDVCRNCRERDATAPHTCPFKADVDGDSITLCNCCAVCKTQCADDI